MKCITSRENPIFKRLIKLEESAKKRRACGLTILDGVHLVNSYHVKLGVPRCLISNESGHESAKIKQLLTLEKSEAVDVFVLSDTLFREISPVKTPTGIIALVPIPAPGDIPVRKSERFCVLLESIQDPGNLGSILRSAAVAGVCDAYLSEGCADAWSPKTLRAAMGAHFLLRIYEQSNLVKVVQEFKGKVIAATLKTNKSLYKTHLTGPIAFAFGNEGIGLSNEVRQAASEQVTIPMVDGTESLNVAAAAAICFFERVRQTQ